MYTLRLATAAVLLGLLAPIGTASAQSLTAQNGATLEVQKELDVPGDLSTSGSSTVTFASGAALTLSGSSAQSVGAEPITVADLTLDNSSGATLNSAVDVTGTLTLTSGPLTTNGNLTLTSSGETSAAAISGSGSGSVSGDVTYERHLAKSDGASHFRVLGAPTTTSLDDEGSGSNVGNLFSNVWTQATGSGADAQVSDPANASVYDYDEGATLGGDALSSAWTDVANLDNSVSPGEGHLAYLFADRDPPAGDGDEGFPVTLTATGPVQAEENSGSAIDLSSRITYTSNDGQSEDGWNLIANPFMAPINWESIENDGTDLAGVQKTIYVWDAAAGQYATYTADGSAGGSGNQDQHIAPFQAFFVKATGSNPDIGGIDSGDKAVGQAPEVKREGASTPKITLRLRKDGDGNASAGETTAFRFAEDADAEKDPYDAYQLDPLAGDYALVASEMVGTDALFDHQNRPVPTEADTIDLALDLTGAGTYALETDTLRHLPDDWKVILENTESGARWDLRAGETATFDYAAPEANTSTSAARSQAHPASTAPLHGDAPTVAKASPSGDEPNFRLYVGPSAALPVEMAAFEAKTEGQTITLRWKTASERDNAGFAVERKAQERSWTQVGFVESNAPGGTTARPQTYRFTDADLPFEAEQVSYRLRQEDLDGSTTRSEAITAALGAPSGATLHAPVPNPARTEATLRYEVPVGVSDADVQIRIYDVLGRQLRTVVSDGAEPGRHEQTVQVDALPAGTYFVRMRAGDTAETQRLTIVR